MQVPKLNFPRDFDFAIRRDKDKFFIYDSVRKTSLLLTPEEWVRQHWIHYFLHEKGYAPSSLLSEKKITLNGLTKRLDLVVTEKTLPKILIECKAPKIPLSQSTFEQIARYNSIVKAETILLSNGLNHLLAKTTEKGYEFIKFEF
ncbi:type I restriction enzyme HsdR N-terminal domain-containing protein [Chryseobacterium sp. A321]